MSKRKKIDILEELKDQVAQLLDSAHELEDSIEEAEASLESEDYLEWDGPKGLELVSAEASDLCTGTSMRLQRVILDLEVDA